MSSSFTHLSSSERAGLESFENFRSAFASAKVSKIARRTSALSTVDPVPFLVSAYQLKPAKKAANKLPGYLQELVGMQEKSGKWVPSTGLYRCLGGSVPDPPDGIEGWRWCTAMAIAFVRRHPEHIEDVRDVYAKGLEWVGPDLLDRARKQLPPLNPYYDLDENLVKKGKWKESVENSFDLGGYQNFLPNALKDDREHFKREIEEAIRREAEEKEKMKEKAEHKEVGLDEKDAKKLRLRVRMEKKAVAEADFKRTKKFDAIEQRRQPLLNVEYKRLAKLNDFKELKKRWESTCTLNEDMKRLKLEKKKKNARKPFDSRIQRVDKAVSKRMELGFQGKSQRQLDGPSPLAKEAIEIANEKIREKRAARTKPLTALEQAIKSVDKSEKWKFEAADQQVILKKNLENCQAQVVSCIIDYESYLEQLAEVLTKAVHAFKASRVVAQRQSSFDELTAMLGQPHTAKKGYNDWRGKDIKGLMTKTVELIESVVRWREAVLAAQGKLGKRDEYGDLIDNGPPLPFMWNGKNILLQIPKANSFLQKSQELVEWYGNDFEFERNPFLLAVPLDKRPETPINDKRVVIQNGEKVEVVAESLLKIANKQKAYMKKCQKTIAEGGSWWPAAGGKEVPLLLMRRIRAAEKVLIKEEAVHGRS